MYPNDSYRKRYTEDFKKMIIEVYNSGKPVLDIWIEYGITTATLYKLIKNPPSNDPKKVIENLEPLITSLKKIRKR
ncbi:hypothetical protein CSC2_01360 [Clostridium zeae]|uniref:Transposase n=1 Tax=Clostridium zeae TaxID=2759022 RepID=A0ABQ1E4D6_9CLOT|nr:hypothetical protein CSC2_01360 [Clostridium zeae]